MLALEITGIVIGVPVIVAVLLYVTQHLVPHTTRRQHNDVAGFVYAVLGVLFTVMLGFVVVDEWQSLETIKTNTFDEANELGTLFWNARALPPATGRALEQTTRDYANVVINTEWSVMNDGESSPQATNIVYTMRDEINALPVDTLKEQTLYQYSLHAVNDLAAARRQRIDESGERVPDIRDRPTEPPVQRHGRRHPGCLPHLPQPAPRTAMIVWCVLIASVPA